MRYEKASAEVIAFVNGCFITTSDSSSGDFSFEVDDDHEDLHRPGGGGYRRPTRPGKPGRR